MNLWVWQIQVAHFPGFDSNCCVSSRNIFELNLTNHLNFGHRRQAKAFGKRKIDSDLYSTGTKFMCFVLNLHTNLNSKPRESWNNKLHLIPQTLISAKNSNVPDWKICCFSVGKLLPSVWLPMLSHRPSSCLITEMNHVELKPCYRVRADVFLRNLRVTLFALALYDVDV